MVPPPYSFNVECFILYVFLMVDYNLLEENLIGHVCRINGARLDQISDYLMLFNLVLNLLICIHNVLSVVEASSVHMRIMSHHSHSIWIRIVLLFLLFFFSKCCLSFFLKFLGIFNIIDILFIIFFNVPL
jgi:hypothetical protein